MSVKPNEICIIQVPSCKVHFPGFELSRLMLGIKQHLFIWYFIHVVLHF